MFVDEMEVVRSDCSLVTFMHCSSSFFINDDKFAVAKSKILGKAKISIQLLRRMKEVSIVPITITLNNILNACAYSDSGYENRREILDIALVILKEAQKTCGANYITYGTALRVIRFFADDYMERWQLIRRVFPCCLALAM